MRDALVLFALIVSVLITLVQPFFGVLSWSVVSYFNPHRFAWGFAREMNPAIFVASATLLGLLFTTKRRFPPMTRETKLLLVLWAWFCITTLVSISSSTFSHHADATLSKLGEVSKILVMTFVSLALVTDKSRLRWWYLVTGGCFAFFAFKSTVFGALTGGQFKIYGPEGSSIADNNDFSLAMNMALPLFLYLGPLEERRWIRWVARISFYCGIVAVILTYSRGGMLGGVAVLLVIALRSKHKALGAGGLAIVVILALALAPMAWKQRMSGIEGASQTDASAQSRIMSWTFAAHLAMDYPITGGGFSTFTPQLQARYGVEQLEGVTFGPHSVYFQFLAEHGFPGLLLFLALVATCLL